jgi:hypothetical protein
MSSGRIVQSLAFVVFSVITGIVAVVAELPQTPVENLSLETEQASGLGFVATRRSHGLRQEGALESADFVADAIGQREQLGSESIDLAELGRARVFAQERLQARRVDRVALCQERDPQNAVLELAHIPEPSTMNEPKDGIVGELKLSSERRLEGMHELRNVFGSLREGWDA